MIRPIAIAALFGLLAACAATDQDVPQDGEVEVTTGEAENAKPSDPEENPEKTYAYTPVRFDLSSPDAEPSAADKKRCEDVGGKVQRAGLAGFYHCVQTYADAGKVCRDSDECMGECRTTDHERIGKAGTGTCQKVDVPFGCYAVVRGGVVDGGMLCVD